jgi:hypothetical protein
MNRSAPALVSLAALVEEVIAKVTGAGGFGTGGSGVGAGLG